MSSQHSILMRIVTGLGRVIDEKDFDLDRLSKMAFADPSTGGNPKKLIENDMKIMYQHSMSGELFK